ncbi:cob(I)yrinic acid a,c-diamide adenosyltransferase [Klebsiella aerogenes]|nr:cob(I)yrinic acid a,c-diamide adenosyltransferase [Klebsiella aerogenes]
MWLQIELAESWQPWLMDIRSRLGNIMRADALEEPLAAQSIAGFSEGQLHRLSHQPLRFLGHDHLVPEARHGREVALLNLLRGKVREAEVTAAQVFITPQFAVRRADIMQALNRPLQRGLRDDDPGRDGFAANPQPAAAAPGR